MCLDLTSRNFSLWYYTVRLCYVCHPIARYYKIERRQEDIMQQVYLILWINGFNGCKTFLQIPREDY